MGHGDRGVCPPQIRQLQLCPGSFHPAKQSWPWHKQPSVAQRRPMGTSVRDEGDKFGAGAKFGGGNNAGANLGHREGQAAPPRCCRRGQAGVPPVPPTPPGDLGPSGAVRRSGHPCGVAVARDGASPGGSAQPAGQAQSSPRRRLGPELPTPGAAVTPSPAVGDSAWRWPALPSPPDPAGLAPAALPGGARCPRCPRRHVPTPPQDTLSFCPAPRAPGHGCQAPASRIAPAASLCLRTGSGTPKTSPPASQIPWCGADCCLPSMSSANPRRRKPLPLPPTPACPGVIPEVRQDGAGGTPQKDGGGRR